MKYTLKRKQKELEFHSYIAPQGLWFQASVLRRKYLIFVPLKFWKACVISLDKIGGDL